MSCNLRGLPVDGGTAFGGHVLGQRPSPKAPDPEHLAGPPARPEAVCGFLELFGPRWSYSSFLLHVLTSPIVLANRVLITHLRLDDRLRPLTAVTIASTLVTLVMACVLLSALGIHGGATGLAAAQALALGLFAIEDRMNNKHMRLARPA